MDMFTFNNKFLLKSWAGDWEELHAGWPDAFNNFTKSTSGLETDGSALDYQQET